MHFVLQTPSLQHLAGVRIVAHLWKQDDVLEVGQRFGHIEPVKDLTNDAPTWQIFKNRMESKVWALPLPQPCKKTLLGFIKPLGTEIIYYCQYYNEENRAIQFRDILLFTQLCWTMHGTIDYAKTAKLLVKDERVDSQTRFELACLNCLEDEARELFRRLAEERGQEWVPVLRYARRKNLTRLILFFTRSINLDVRGDLTLFSDIRPYINKRLFDDTLRGGNRGMCEYLFPTLSSEEKMLVLQDFTMTLFCCVQSPTCILFYLSLLNEEQQEENIMAPGCTVGIMLFLLRRWPLQSLFLEAVKCGGQFMDDIDCMSVLFDIIRKINDGLHDFDYCPLFWACWRLLTADFARRLLGYNVLFLDNLLLTSRVEFMELILSQTPSHQLENTVIKISRLLGDESLICDAALMECKETCTTLMSRSNDQDNVEKRLRSQHLSRLIDLVMESRI